MNIYEAIERLREIEIQINELAGEAESIVRDQFPGEVAYCEAYGIFNMTGSANPYDSTFAKLIDSLDEEVN